MRILILSNAPNLPVGYGTLMKYLIPAFSMEHKVGAALNYGIVGEGVTFLRDYPDVPFYGSGPFNTFSEDTALRNYSSFDAEIMMPIFDIWALVKIPAAGAAKKIVLIPYVPLDSEILSPDMIRAASGCHKLIPMSMHAERVFKEKFPDKTLPHIPGGVNTEIFKPRWNDMIEKGQIKKALGFDADTFVIGIGGDIKAQRKSFAENLVGIKRFIEKNPRLKVGMYCHTQMSPMQGDQHNMSQLISDLGLESISRSTEPNAYVKGYTEDELCEMYNGCDVWLAASRGEGFGLQFLEAQSSGTAVIGTDFTSMPQVVGSDSGLLVRPAIKGYDQSGAIKAIPDPEAISDALAAIWMWMATKPNTVRDEARSFAMRFDWEKVIFPKWSETLRLIESDMLCMCVRVVPPAEERIDVAKKIEVFG